MRFCPKCGKNIEKGTFCNECMPKKEIFIKDIKIKVCTSCRKYNSGINWIRYKDFNEVIQKIVEKKLKNKIENPKIEFKLEMVKKPGTSRDFEVEVTDNEEKFLLPIKIDYTYCTHCRNKTGSYYEGDLQLRSKDKKILDYIKKELGETYVEKEEVGNGYDIRVTNKRKLSALGNKLIKKFGGVIKKNEKLYSHDPQTSKDLFRLNVYFKPYNFYIGDIVQAEGKVVKITKIGKVISGLELSTGRKTSFNPKDYKVLEVFKTTISQLKPEIQVLHPQTYQNIRAVNTSGLELHNGEKVKVVLAKSNTYII